MNVRRFLHQRFACPVIDLFGSTELGYLYYSDRDGRYWPHLAGMSVELLPVAPGSTIHQLIVTSVRNPYMPLVRYRSGDCVRTLDGSPDPAAITQFCGRQKELLSTPNGPVAQGDLDRHIADASPGSSCTSSISTATPTPPCCTRRSPTNLSGPQRPPCCGRASAN